MTKWPSISDFLKLKMFLENQIITWIQEDESCATPETAAHQALLSLGFSRQKHWSGLPFPSPMHESEKWKWSRVWLLATPWIAAHQAPLSMEFYRQEYWNGVPLPSPYIVTAAAAAAAKSLQSCPTLCDPRDGSPSGSARQEHWSGLPLPSLKNYKKIKKKERTYSN